MNTVLIFLRIVIWLLCSVFPDFDVDAVFTLYQVVIWILCKIFPGCNMDSVILFSGLHNGYCARLFRIIVLSLAGLQLGKCARFSGL